MKTADQLTIEALQQKLLDSQGLIEDLYAQRKATFQDTGSGGTYRKIQDPDAITNSELLTGPRALWEKRNDKIVLSWSNLAQVKFQLPGPHYQIDGSLYLQLPVEVRAEGWWHLCAQVGVIEPIARLFYAHPENGQPSAVRASPRKRGVVIACEGDYLP